MKAIKDSRFIWWLPGVFFWKQREILDWTFNRDLQYREMVKRSDVSDYLLCLNILYAILLFKLMIVLWTYTNL
jgi:hypothetical protein